MAHARRKASLHRIVLAILLAGAVACGSDGGASSAGAALSDGALAQLSVEMEPSSNESRTASAAVSAAVSVSREAEPEGTSSGFDPDNVVALDTGADDSPTDELSSSSTRDEPDATSFRNGEGLLTASSYGRDVVYRANMRVDVDDVGSATETAIALVQSFGGYLFSQQTHMDPNPESRLTFKVPPADFTDVLRRLGSIGEMKSQEVSALDVTGRVVDLESRIITSQLSVDRLREFLRDATGLDNVARLEQELLIRETDLETLRGQLRALGDQVSLATVDVTFSIPPEPPEPPPPPVPYSAMNASAWASTADSDPCLGDTQITTEPDDTANFCLEIENAGDVALTDVRITVNALRIRSDRTSPNSNTFSVTQGDLDRIEPGELLVATLSEPVVDSRLAGTVASRLLQIDFEIEATPVSNEGDPLDALVGTPSVFVQVAEPDETISDFPTALRRGYEAFVDMAVFLSIILGAILPFLVGAAPVVAVGWWLWRRRAKRQHRGQTTETDENGGSATPARVDADQ